MRGKILFALGLGVGYVFGTRAGRARYNQIKSAALKVWNDPRVRGGRLRDDQREEGCGKGRRGSRNVDVSTQARDLLQAQGVNEDDHRARNGVGGEVIHVR